MIEEGLCGRTSVFEDELRAGRRGADFLPVLLETHRPLGGIILMLGTNDCKRVYGASAEVIGKGIEKLLLQIRTDDRAHKVLLISPILLGERVWEEGFDPEFDEKGVETSKRLKGIYRDLAEKYGYEFLAASDYARPSEVDREHLDEAGHHQLAEAIYQKLKGVWNLGL
jgi:lysophospholipase L1-like esterase